MDTTFSAGQILHLPEIAAQLKLNSPEFRVDLVLKGGMGECIRVAQGEMHFALKVIQREVVENDEAWGRYLREVRLWVTLSACDGVAEALCLTRVNELPVVCSRWMQGGNLGATSRTDHPSYFSQ